MTEFRDINQKQITSPIDGTDTCYYEKGPDGSESYLCMSSGYTTNSNFKKGSSEIEAALANSPRLIREVMFYDKKRDLVWFPVIMNMGQRGIIYPEGSKDEWNWKYASVIEIPKDEQKNYPIPNKDGKFYETKLDVENALTYDKWSFMHACDDMGILEKLKGEDSGQTEDIQS